MAALIEAFARGETPPHGSQTGRMNSAPEGTWTTLTETVPTAGDD
jgi:hypothetical protein